MIQSMKRKKFRLPRKKIAELCQRRSITEFSLFGSVLRECLRPQMTTGAQEVAGRMHMARASLQNDLRMNSVGGSRGI
jgi:hypothetical protein